MAAARRCKRCGTFYPPHLVESAFRIGGGHGRALDASSAPRRNRICRPCEQTARDQSKIGNRWTVKSRDVIRRHAVRLDVPKDDLVSVYGWDQARLAHDAEHQYGNGCNYCGHAYHDMGHGLADITLDIVDRSKPPYYRTNTKWCCQTCNRKKGAQTPEEFEIDRQVYECWSEQQRRGWDPVTDDPDSIFYQAQAS